MSYNFSQTFNPHNLRRGTIVDWNSFNLELYLIQNNDSLPTVNLLAATINDDKSKLFLHEKLNNLNLSIYSAGLSNRKINLIKLFGKNEYNRIKKKINVKNRW